MPQMVSSSQGGCSRLTHACIAAHPLWQSEDAFRDAAREGKLAEVQEHLRNGVNVHAKDWDGRPALHRAADNGHMEVVTALLAAGADINLQDKVRNCWLRRVRVRGRVRGRGVICMQICMGVFERRIFFLCL